MTRKAVNFAAFYAGWAICVGGAARGSWWIGPLAVALIVIPQWATSPQRAHEFRLMTLVGVLGTLLDSVQALAGFVRFPGAGFMAPPYITALWVLFASTVNESMAWLKDRPWTAAALGAFSGPVSYYSAARWGAISLPQNLVLTMVELAIAWAIATPGIFFLDRRLRYFK